MIKSFQSFIPKIAEDAFIAENATVIGEVSIGSRSSVWYQAVIRGDVGALVIGEETNVQDGAVIHCSEFRTQTHIGNRVVIGHQAMLHGCTIEDEVLVGMSSIILDEVYVPSHTIIAAGALIPERTHLESGYIYAGVPAKKLKKASPEQIAHINTLATRYVRKAKLHQEARILTHEDCMSKGT
ncbi:MAG: gamma carbonic anhydrase family protein [Bacteroidota bacterium]